MGPRYEKSGVVLMWHHIPPIMNHPRSIQYCSLVQETNLQAWLQYGLQKQG
jgi:hypothetical protein